MLVEDRKVDPGIVGPVPSRPDDRIYLDLASVFEVEDQDRAFDFWTKTIGFELVQDAQYGDERWLEVRTRDKAVTIVLSLREGERPTAPEMLPTSNVFFYCDDLSKTYEELRSRGVEFPQPPAEQPFGWWSMFEDPEGNRFALAPRE